MPLSPMLFSSAHQYANPLPVSLKLSLEENKKKVTGMIDTEGNSHGMDFFQKEKKNRK
jgi:hypothetical protein